MSRMGDGPSTAGSSGGGDRWNAERFIRERDERREYSPSRRDRRPTVGVMERDRTDTRIPFSLSDDYARQDRYGPPARRSDRDYNDEHLISTADAVIPYESRRTISPGPRFGSDPFGPNSGRPTLLRRQSSLDTFDLAATKRASDSRQHDRADYGPRVSRRESVSQRGSAPRKRSVSRRPEPYLDEIRVAEPDYYGDEEFRNMRDREASATPRGRRYSTLREEVVRENIARPGPRRGKTRIPKRLVHPHAVVDLGYTYEDEGDTILISKALAKENIDEIIEYSRVVKRGNGGTEVKEKERITIGARPQPVSIGRSRSRSRRRPSNAQTTEIVESRRRYSPSPFPLPRVRHHQRRRSSPIRIVEPSVEDVIRPRRDVELILPQRHRRSSRDLRAEIRDLEERKWREEPITVEQVEVKRDYKAPTPRLIRAMMATLT